MTRPRLVAALAAGALFLGACGGGGDDDPASNPTVPADLNSLVGEFENYAESLDSEEAARMATAIQQTIQEVIAEAVARAGDPMSDEELAALFRQKMVEAGVPLPE